MEGFTQNNTELGIQHNEPTINIREEIDKYLIHWRWFVVAVLMALFLAFVYLRYSTPQYSVTSSIMIKDNQKSGISDELKAVADLGIVGTGSANNTDNEIEIIKSRKIVGRVVDSLVLNVIYFTEGHIKTSEVYGNNPIMLQFLEKPAYQQTKDTTLLVRVLNNNQFQLQNAEGTVLQTLNFGEMIENKTIGKFSIFRNDTEQIAKEQDVIISIRNRDKLIDSYLSRITVTPVNKNSSVVTLSLQDPVKQKAEDILNKLADQYNLDAITDKNIVSIKTKEFIEERLQTVSLELSGIQDNFKQYKDQFGITGYSEEGVMALEEV